MSTPLNMFGKALPRKRLRIHTTLLDLAQAANQVTDDDRQVTAIVAHLVNSGHARLMGTFKGRRVIIE